MRYKHLQPLVAALHEATEAVPLLPLSLLFGIGGHCGLKRAAGRSSGVLPAKKHAHLFVYSHLDQRFELVLTQAAQTARSSGCKKDVEFPRRVDFGVNFGSAEISVFFFREIGCLSTTKTCILNHENILKHVFFEAFCRNMYFLCVLVKYSEFLQGSS